MEASLPSDGAKQSELGGLWGCGGLCRVGRKQTRIAEVEDLAARGTDARVVVWPLFGRGAATA